MMALALRLLVPADYQAVDPILSAAYARSGSMLDDLARYYQHQPDGWFLASLDGVPVGMGGVLAYGSIARIGLMAVHPNYQGQGIGRAIMNHLLDWAANRGATTVLLDATPAGLPLYRQLGFVTDDEAQAYVCAAPLPPAEPPAATARLIQPDDMPAVLAFDAERFGAARGAVLTRYYQDFAERAFLTQDAQGTVTGYLIAQEHRLGPWLAETPEAAESLLQQALPLFSGQIQVIVPACNQHASTLLQRAGFTPGRRWYTMRRGGAPELHRRQWLYGYANFYIG